MRFCLLLITTLFASACSSCATTSGDKGAPMRPGKLVLSREAQSPRAWREGSQPKKAPRALPKLVLPKGIRAVHYVEKHRK